MLGHRHVSGDNKSVAKAERLQLMLEDTVCCNVFQERLRSIATEGEKADNIPLLIADETLRVAGEFYTGNGRLGICGFPPIPR